MKGTRLQNKELKPSQKKGPKKFPGAPFSVSFFTAGSWEKDTENGAPGIFFGTSYFERALENMLQMCCKLHIGGIIFYKF